MAAAIRIAVLGWLQGWAKKRPPNVVIGQVASPYLLRWHLLPRNPVLNLYLHWILRSDDDRALHNHPWVWNLSWLLEGGYWEVTKTNWFRREAGQLILRGSCPHRLVLGSKPAWSLFATGPWVRNWGFFCPNGFVRWQDFTKPGDPGQVGRGCE